MTTNGFSRRTVLSGLGLSMGLPWLESIAPAAAASSVGPTPPLRMGFIFVPNGVHLPDWTPQAEGYGFDLPYILEPLAAVQNDLTVVTGLTHDKGRANGDGPGDHARSASVFLTGAQPRKTSGADIRSGTSVDQAAAQQAGKATRFASLELGCEGGRSAGNCDSGYSCAYSSSISWSSESTPLGKETNPRAVFERLFGNGQRKEMDKSQKRRMALQKSILDFISEDAAKLQKQLGRNDQQKLDEYLESVRQIEQRVQQSERWLHVPKPQVNASDLHLDADDSTPRELISTMYDLMLLAFQTDSTRVATYQLGNMNGATSIAGKFPQLLGFANKMHSLAHGARKGEKGAENLGKWDQFLTEQLARFLTRLRETQEGDGNLLDHTMVLYGSSNSYTHNNQNYPLVVAGGGQLGLKHGQYLRYGNDVPMSNLLVTMLNRLDTPVERFVDSTGELAEIIS